MIYIRAADAARLLRVSTATLEAWEERFGFPISFAAQDGPHAYTSDEVIALRDALETHASVTTAVDHARAALVRRGGRSTG